MTLIISINKLKVNTILGIYEYEKDTKREVIIDIDIYCSSFNKAEKQTIDSTVDYHSLANSIIEHVESRSFDLIEELLDDVLNICIKAGNVDKAYAKVYKPNVMDCVESFSVSGERIA